MAGFANASRSVEPYNYLRGKAVLAYIYIRYYYILKTEKRVNAWNKGRPGRHEFSRFTRHYGSRGHHDVVTLKPRLGLLCRSGNLTEARGSATTEGHSHREFLVHNYRGLVTIDKKLPPRT